VCWFFKNKDLGMANSAAGGLMNTFAAPVQAYSAAGGLLNTVAAPGQANSASEGLLNTAAADQTNA